ncbi:hypothetical protein AMJ57_00990 [Parcubacteria bacterium SG8_24]|nr:MAG: hypothetical protein AMJ57_00990 [Parcubacteria bacterium SG8_24]
MTQWLRQEIAAGIAEFEDTRAERKALPPHCRERCGTVISDPVEISELFFLALSDITWRPPPLSAGQMLH